MKYGLELLAIANEAKVQRRIEEKMKNEQAHTNLITCKINTIKWCDTVLSDYLEKMANIDPYFMRGEWTYYKNDLLFDCLDGIKSKKVCLSELFRYSDIWRRLASKKNCFILDLDTVIDYCNQHCIEVKTCKFRLNSYYGADNPYAIGLSFRISPSCFKQVFNKY